MSIGEHEAAVLKCRNSALFVTKRPTPAPGPDDILIDVHSIALNPVDEIQRKRGFNVPSYPRILGSDISGVVKAVGSNMPADSPRIGDRVTAYAPAWFVKNSNDYGAFQKLVLVPSDNVTVIPDSMTFNEASIFPLAVLTSWYSLFTCGVERDASYGQADKQGILIWGVGGSVGSIALQIAKSLGFYIYATASQKHHAYLQTLGQGPGTVKLFDYKDKDVVHKIITAAKEDGVKVHRAIEAAAGNLKDCIRILRETKGDRSVTPKIAAAPFSLAMLWYRLLPTWWTGATVQFVHIVDDKQSAGFRFVFRTWLGPKLASGLLVPSPQIQVVPGGLAGIQAGLDIWSKGVSGVKLVVELP